MSGASNKVLIATDGSPTARETARRAGELLGQVDSVTVLAVLTDLPGDDAGGIEGPTESPEETERMLEGEQRDAATAIDEVVSVLPEAWRPLVTRRVEVGDAGPMIVWVAEHERSDVIAVGSHGHGILKRLLMGSVSKHVTHHAPCPVLLVRAVPD
jgi:nucleotide-binding universal stress UspA family protein